MAKNLETGRTIHHDLEIMKTRFLLLAAMMWAQVAISSDSKLIDDAPKGFIHVTRESYGAETHEYIKVSTLNRIRQFPEEDEGKLRHHIWLYNEAENVVQLEFSTKEEADKVRVKILELMSAKD